MPNHFVSERAMHAPMMRMVERQLRREAGIWVLASEHRAGTRIPDLIAARIDPSAFESRLGHAVIRPLALADIRAMHALGQRSWREVGTISESLRVTLSYAKRILTQLAEYGLVESRFDSAEFRRCKVWGMTNPFACSQVGIVRTTS